MGDPLGVREQLLAGAEVLLGASALGDLADEAKDLSMAPGDTAGLVVLLVQAPGVEMVFQGLERAGLAGGIDDPQEVLGEGMREDIEDMAPEELLGRQERRGAPAPQVPDQGSRGAEAKDLVRYGFQVIELFALGAELAELGEQLLPGFQVVVHRLPSSLTVT
ncbi:hypothetical protein D3C87_749800 [compost metagenome]